MELRTVLQASRHPTVPLDSCFASDHDVSDLFLPIPSPYRILTGRARHDTPEPKEGVDFILVYPAVHQIPRDGKRQQSLSRVLKDAGVDIYSVASDAGDPRSANAPRSGGWRLQWG